MNELIKWTDYDATAWVTPNEVQTWGWNRSRASCSRKSKNYYARAAIATRICISVRRWRIRTSSPASPSVCCKKDRMNIPNKNKLKKWLLSAKICDHKNYSVYWQVKLTYERIHRETDNLLNYQCHWRRHFPYPLLFRLSATHKEM